MLVGMLEHRLVMMLPASRQRLSRCLKASARPSHLTRVVHPMSSDVVRCCHESEAETLYVEGKRRLLKDARCLDAGSTFEGGMTRLLAVNPRVVRDRVRASLKSNSISVHE